MSECHLHLWAGSHAALTSALWLGRAKLALGLFLCHATAKLFPGNSRTLRSRFPGTCHVYCEPVRLVDPQRLHCNARVSCCPAVLVKTLTAEETCHRWLQQPEQGPQVSGCQLHWWAGLDTVQLGKSSADLTKLHAGVTSKRPCHMSAKQTPDNCCPYYRWLQQPEQVLQV